MDISVNYASGPYRAGDYVINIKKKELEALELMILKLYKYGEFIEHNHMMEEMLKEIESVLIYPIEEK